MDPGHNLNADLPAGTQVGEYQVQSKLGEGGFGSVFRAVHPLIGKEAAIKVLHQEFSVNPEMVQRFISEARAVNQIRHRNIIDIFSFGRLEDGRCYYVMELLKGHTLDGHMHLRGRLDAMEALSILRAVARALDAAHAKGIAHRDLKPENVFVGVDEEGRPFPKLLDFGIAKLLIDDTQKQYKTRTGAPMGTPPYMSPEQCRGVAVDHRTDIYAFGIMTYEMFTGHRPFEGESFMDIMFKQMSEEPTPPSAHGLPAGLNPPILWMLRKNPDERPPDLKTAVTALEEAAQQAGMFTGNTGQTAPVPGRLPTSTPVPVFANPNDPTVAAPPLRTPSLVAPGLADPTLMSAILDKPARRSRVPLVAGILVVAALVGVIAVVSRGGSPRRDPAPAVTAVPDPTPSSPNAGPAITAPSGTPSPTPSPVPATVTLTITGEPADMRVLGPDGADLGRAPGAIVLPRGDAPVKLQVVADGYTPIEREVTPTADGTLEVRLDKERPRGARPDRKPKKPGKDDLENPF